MTLNEPDLEKEELRTRDSGLGDVESEVGDQLHILCVNF